MSEIQNREAWLIQAAIYMTPWLEAIPDVKVPPLRVSVGWPGGRAKKTVTVGQCWPTTAAEDGVAQIFMSPIRGKESTIDVLGTLLHEMIHAVDDCESGHQGNFIRIAREVGFIPKWTSSDNRGEALQADLEELAEKLGEFPSAAILGGQAADTPKTQTNRQLKVECAGGTGYKARLSRKWLEEYGPPVCPCCGVEMEEG